MKPDIIEQNGNQTVAVGYLKKLGVSEEEIRSGITKYLDRQSDLWKCEHLTAGEEVYIEASSLPDHIFKLIEDSQTLNLTKGIESDNLLRGQYQLDLLHAYTKGYEDFIGKFERIKNEKSRIKYAKKYAIFQECLRIYFEMLCEKNSILTIYYTLRHIGVNYYQSPKSFRRKFREVRMSDDFADSIIHGLSIIEKHPAQKVDEWMILKIVDLMGEKKLKVEILDEINKDRPPKKKISYSTLLKYITAEVKNITAEKRYGYDFYKKHVEPYIRRQKPDYKYQVVEADGSRLQLPYRNEANKIKFLKIYVIIDRHSSLILGFSLAEEENTQMIMLAFQMMLDQYHYIPACIITDKASSHTSTDFTTFKSNCNILFNTLWREHFPDFPNAKGTVENFFRNFHILVVRKYFGYFGLGRTATSDDHKLNKDELKKIEKNRHLLKTKSELIHFAGNLIQEWNTRISKEMSPQQKHNRAPIMDAQPISEEFIARLCWKKAERLIKKCTIHLGNYEYDLEQNDNRIKWNGEIVDVYYHSSMTDHLFLFKDNEFIEKVYKKRFYTEESGSKFQKIAQNKSLRQYAKDLYKQNKKQLAELEKDDPIIGVVYDADKEHSNEYFSEFIDNYYLDEQEVEDVEEFEFEDMPEITL